MIPSRHWEQSTLYHTGDSQCTQNIQINKVIGENEKYVFYFTEKPKGTFGQPNISFDLLFVTNINYQVSQIYYKLFSSEVSYGFLKSLRNLKVFQSPFARKIYINSLIISHPTIHYKHKA